MAVAARVPPDACLQGRPLYSSDWTTPESPIRCQAASRASLGLEQDLAGDVASIEERVGCADLLESEDSIDVDLQIAGLNERVKSLELRIVALDGGFEEADGTGVGGGCQVACVPFDCRDEDAAGLDYG